jgi:hypothetical protein
MVEGKAQTGDASVREKATQPQPTSQRVIMTIPLSRDVSPYRIKPVIVEIRFPPFAFDSLGVQEETAISQFPGGALCTDSDPRPAAPRALEERT